MQAHNHSEFSELCHSESALADDPMHADEDSLLNIHRILQSLLLVHEARNPIAHASAGLQLFFQRVTLFYDK